MERAVSPALSYLFSIPVSDISGTGIVA
jgi:hypothetical protein